MTEDKESFISDADRPKVGLDPDTPISELRVRDLQAILGGGNLSSLGQPLKPVSKDRRDNLNEIARARFAKQLSEKFQKDAKDLPIEIKEEIPPDVYENWGLGRPMDELLVGLFTEVSGKLDILTREVESLRGRG